MCSLCRKTIEIKVGVEGEREECGIEGNRAIEKMRMQGLHDILSLIVPIITC